MGNAIRKSALQILGVLASCLILSVHLDLPSHKVPDSCRAESTYQDCQFKFQVPDVKCRYVKGNDFKNDIVPLDKKPGPARELNAGLVRDSNNLLISWNLPFDSSLPNLQGFLLNVTFIYNGTLVSLLRTFIIDANFLGIKEQGALSEIVITYNCIQTFGQMLYTIKLLSYPLSTIPSSQEVEIYVPDLYHPVTPEALTSGEWRATMWSIVHSNGRMALDICFYGAPAKFAMREYYLFLMTEAQERSPDRGLTAKDVVQVENFTEMEGKKECRTFGELPPNDYYAELLPFGPEECSCTYRVDDTNKELCRDSCLKTVMGPIALKGYMDRVLPAVRLSLVIAVCVSCSVMIVICVVFLLVWIRKKKKKSDMHGCRGTLLILIINEPESPSTFSAPLTKHLESRLFDVSCLDLSSNSRLPTEHLEAGHDSYVIIHRAQNNSCNVRNLGKPDMAKDSNLATTVNKFFKEFCVPRICVHTLYLKRGSHPKVSLLKILDDMKCCSFIVPPGEEERDGLLEAFAPNSNSNSSICFLGLLSPSSPPQQDSGIDLSSPSLITQ